MFKLKLNLLCVKYVSIILKDNLLKLNVNIIYVMNVINSYYKLIKIKNVQYVDNMIG